MEKPRKNKEEPILCYIMMLHQCISYYINTKQFTKHSYGFKLRNNTHLDKIHLDIKHTYALALRRNVFQFHFYEFECGHHQICTQQPHPSHEAKQKQKCTKRKSK